MARTVTVPDKPAAHFRYHRHAYARHALVLRVGLVHLGSSTDPCLVRNISERGMTVRVYRKLTPGDSVAIELRVGEVLKGSVVWARDWEIGISFPDPVDVTAILESRWAGETGKRARMPRFEVNCPAKVRVGPRFYNVRLCNISEGGAKLLTQKPLSVEGGLLLTVPDLPPLSGHVRWSHETNVGISFREPLPSRALAEWLQERRRRSVPLNGIDTAVERND